MLEKIFTMVYRASEEGNSITGTGIYVLIGRFIARFYDLVFELLLKILKCQDTALFFVTKAFPLFPIDPKEQKQRYGIACVRAGAMSTLC